MLPALLNCSESNEPRSFGYHHVFSRLSRTHTLSSFISIKMKPNETYELNTVNIQTYQKYIARQWQVETKIVFNA